jgi:hypothetical protein
MDSSCLKIIFHEKNRWDCQCFSAAFIAHISVVFADFLKVHQVIVGNLLEEI